MIKKTLISLLLVCFFDNVAVLAQQGKVDNTFNVIDDGSYGDGFDNVVRTLFLQSDEKLLVGGDYLSLNGIGSSYLSLLTPEGALDESFNTGSGFNGKVYSCYVQPDGKIIVGGSFTTYKNVTSGRLIRLNTDGSIDETFNTTIGATTGIIYKICLQADGKIIIVGSFTKYNNVTVNRIARILPNGALDSTFMTGSGSALNITNVEVLPNNEILLGGNFTSFNGAPANRIIRLNSDGRTDNSFDVGSGFNDDVNAMVVQSDGKIILGGKFTTYNGIVANRIIRINENGAVDDDFLSGSGLSDDTIQVIKTDALGNIMVGGSFTGYYNNVKVNRVFLLNPNGILKIDFDIGSGPGSASVLALERSQDGSWFIGGSFTVFDGQNQGRLAKINSDGEHEIAYLSAGVGFDNSVLKVLPLENKETMVFGNFNKFNGVSASKIALLSEDGTLNNTFNTGQLGANNLIKTAALQADKKIVFGGNFTKYNEITCNRICRILPNGKTDSTFEIGTGFNNQVYSIAIQPDGKIIVAGNFTIYNGTTVGRIVRLLPNGSVDATFNVGTGADAIIEAVLIQPDGKILVGGRFNNFNKNSFSSLIRLMNDGSIDFSFNVRAGFDKNVYSIALQSDRKIIVGGSFLAYNGISQKRIARLQVDGNLDTTFDSGIGFSKGDVLTILVQPDNRVLVGGTFSGTYKNVPSLRLIRLLASGEYDNSFTAPLNNKLYSMNFTADQKLIIGGNFNSISGVSKHKIARLKLCLDATTWEDSKWSNGFPSGGKQIYFKDDYSNLTTVNVCSCKIDEGKKVTVLEGSTFGIEFDYSGLGTLVLEDTASLYQSDDDIINTGIVNAKRKSSPILKFDFTYWSSCVSDQKLINVSPHTLPDKFFSFDYSLKNWKLENSSNNMIVGKGYIIRGPETFSTTIPSKFEATFKGIPNNGKVNIDLGPANVYSLIGNPYPSALDADVFLKSNVSKIKGTLYFWTHNTPFSNKKYASDDYAVYNLLGGVATRGALSSGINETIPDGTIASGQSFFAVSKGLGDAEFNDSMRIKGKNSSFFKPGKSKEATEMNSIEKHRLWLNFENTEGVFKQILLGYIDGATEFFDENYDALTFNSNKFVDFYSIVENKKLVIQARGLPLIDTDVILLGYKSTIDGDFTFAIDHTDGFFKNLEVFIEDKDLKVTHDLKKEPYLFNTKAGTFNDRFELKFIDKNLNTNNFTEAAKNVLVSVKNQWILVNAFEEEIMEVSVFDVSGKVVYHKNKIENSKLSIQNTFAKNQVLFVKIKMKEGKITTRKIII